MKTESSEKESYRYWAFISYSHQDKKWGDWLHRALETYRVPKSLVGTENARGELVPKRVFPTFRDREELPTSADLGENIHEALRQSKYLIVICSPRSATSRWVDEEIRYFKSLGKENRILCLIVDGEPNAADKPESGLQECFPEAVKCRLGPDGGRTLERVEPIAADVRKDRPDQFDEILAKYNKIIELVPDDADAFWNRGQILYLQKKYQQAEQDFRMTCILAPDFSDASVNLGWLLITQKRFEEAEPYCQKAYELNPVSWAGTTNLGYLHLFKGETKEAYALFRKALNQNPNREAFEAGPVADFQLFIKNGWHVEACRKALAWMREEFEKQQK